MTSPNKKSDTPTLDDIRLSENLIQHLQEMKKLDMHVPDKALQMAADYAVIREYAGMRESELADLLIELADLEDTSETPSAGG